MNICSLQGIILTLREKGPFSPVWEALANRLWKGVELERLGKTGTSPLLSEAKYIAWALAPHFEKKNLNFII